MSKANKVLCVLEKYPVPFSGIFKGYFSLSRFPNPQPFLSISDHLDLSSNPALSPNHRLAASIQCLPIDSLQASGFDSGTYSISTLYHYQRTALKGIFIGQITTGLKQKSQTFLKQSFQTLSTNSQPSELPLETLALLQSIQTIGKVQ